MKSFCFFLLLGLIQLSPSSANNSTLKNKLFKLCNQELNKLANETCVKFKHLAEQMLEDPVVQKAESSLMQEFKWNVTYFLENYSTLMNYGLYEQLLQIFAQTTSHYFHQQSKDKDFQYILKLLRIFDYDQIYDDYVIKFKEFVHKILLPNVEELKNSNTNNETKQWETVLKSANELKECKDYNCFYYTFKSFYEALLTSREQLFEVITQEFQDFNIFYAFNATLIAKGILTDPRLSQLNSSEQQLSLDLKDYIQQYESNRDVNQLNDLLNTFYRNVLSKYFDFFNDENLENDQRLLKQIYCDHGFENFEIEQRERFYRFVSERLLKEFKYLKPFLSGEGLEKAKLILEESLTRFTQYKTRETAVDTFCAI